MLSTAKTKEAKLALVEKQKGRFFEILVKTTPELKDQPERVKEHQDEFEKLVDLIFQVDLETGKVCQYVYDTVFRYDQKKLGRTVVSTMEEYEKAINKAKDEL